MKRNNFKILSYLLITIFLTLGLSISFQSLLAAWTAPSSNPPACDPLVDAGCNQPINVGSSKQSKGGPLTVNFDNIAATGLVAWGNVGIGTAAPGSPLSFGTGLGAKIALYDTGVGTGYGFGMQSTLLQIYANSVTDRVGIGYGSSAAFTETLSVKGGNVGIGTTAPGAKLDVAGSFRAGAATGKKIYYSSVAVPASTGNSTHSIYLGRISSGSTKLTIYASGYGTEHTVEYTLTRRWGVSQPKIVQRIGDVYQLVSLHYADVGDNTHSDIFAVYTYSAPAGNVNNLFITVETNGSSDWSQPAGVIIPTLNAGNALPLGLTSMEGNVGIGTTNPGARLDVNGDLRISGGDLYANAIKGRAGNAEQIWLGDNNDTIVINNKLCIGDPAIPANCKIGWAEIGGTSGWTRNSASGFLYPTTLTDKVGIGTTAPSGKLQVQDGTVIFSGTTGATPVSGAGTRLMWIPAKGAFRAGVVTGTRWDDANIGANSIAGGVDTQASGDSSISFGRSNNASGYNAVAIGGAANASGNGAIALGNTFIMASGAGSMVFGSGLDPGNPLVNNIDNSLMVGFRSTYPTLFVGPASQNGQSGNVGIGTTAPNSKLTVAGTIESTSGGIKFPDATIQTTAYAGGSQLITAANVSSGAFGSNTGNGFYGLPNKVSIGYGASSTPSTIEQTGMLSVNGNVGIGTTNPSATLELSKSGGKLWQFISDYSNTATDRGILAIVKARGTSAAPAAVQGGDWLGSFSFLGRGNTNNLDAGGIVGIAEGNFTDSSSPGALSFRTVPAGSVIPVNRIYIQSGGNVGIGTTNPGYKLSIEDETTDAFISIKSSVSGLAGILFGDGANAIKWQIAFDNSDDSMRFFSGVSGEAVRILSSGNVGIGTPDPGAKLEVAGQVKITGGNPGANKVLTSDAAGLASWQASAANNAPFFIETIYGDGDLPWRSTSNVAQTMRNVYGPFGYSMPACGAGYTKYYRLYAESVDNISSGGQGVYVRIALIGGTNIDFNLGSTWGGSPSYRTFLSGLFQTADTNHANIQSWINGSAGPYLEIRKLQIWAYCL